ncbi:Lin0512 family protein [Halobacillus sp. Marseille-Q1614]|uniref:Lin0512 family protein n=1 Tax=Halobacillus sp. Marseille-Q1614 TaxID=2709134 RepID=UPI00156E530A|nr:Lin0512 family protein [Halobacillus sp. Marseille-Q1614]
MDKMIFVQTGMGIDVHGQNVTHASVRAIKNAINSNSMPGIQESLPDGDLDNMKVHVKLAIPTDLDNLDEDEVKKAIPYGKVTVEKVQGGMMTSSGIELKDKGDKNDQMYLVNAAVEVGY